jgi:hypothetical protein
MELKIMSIIRKLVHLITFLTACIVVFLRSIPKILIFPFILIGYVLINPIVRLQAHYLKKFEAIQTFIYNRMLLYYGHALKCPELIKDKDRAKSESSV